MCIYDCLFHRHPPTTEPHTISCSGCSHICVCTIFSYICVHTILFFTYLCPQRNLTQFALCAPNNVHVLYYFFEMCMCICTIMFSTYFRPEHNLTQIALGACICRIYVYVLLYYTYAYVQFCLILFFTHAYITYTWMYYCITYMRMYNFIQSHFERMHISHICVCTIVSHICIYKIKVLLIFQIPPPAR